ncbi:MAG: spermidine synthase, partial [Polaribacter sp.]
ADITYHYNTLPVIYTYLKAIKNTMDINGTGISSTADEHGPIYVYQTRTSRILSFAGKTQQSYMKLNHVNGLNLGYT